MPSTTTSVILLFFCASFAAAAPIAVSSYTMNNGNTATFNYRDFSYVPCNGVCDVSGAALSGGTGKLTDGLSPNSDWDQEGQLTSWVGWDSFQPGATNPSIVFNFGSVQTVQTVTVWSSNSRSGGVALPGAITIGGNVFTITPDLAVTTPRALVFSGLNITGGSLTVQLDQAAGFNWVMIGEVSFDGEAVAVPEPGATAMLGLGLLGSVLFGRRAR